MRMKMFAADTFDAAKAMIFAEMGDDAVILSERETDDGVEVRAAVDRMSGSGRDTPMFLTRPDEPHRAVTSENPLRQRIRDSLLWHGAPMHFAHRVADAGAPMGIIGRDPTEAIAIGLETLIACNPIPAMPDKNILLVGPPGHGRTSTTAKLTRRAALTNARLHPLAADIDGAAGGAQLAAYLEQERDQIHIATTPDELFNMLTTISTDETRYVIDLPAIIPFDREDMASLKDLIAAINVEPVLVMSAEGHPDDQAEAAKLFAKVGVERAILTKLDVTKRRGGAVAALSSANIAFSHLAVTPFIGGGLVPAAPNRLANLLLEDTPAHVAMKGAA